MLLQLFSAIVRRCELVLDIVFVQVLTQIRKARLKCREVFYLARSFC